MRDREKKRGRDTGRGEASSMQGTQCGTRFGSPGSPPEPKADA